MTTKVRQRAMNYDVFERKYKPVKNHIDSNASGDGDLFETYGEEWEHVSKQDCHHVWTLVESDTGKKEYLTPGFHVVNRLNYMITEKPWTDEDDANGLQVLYA